MTLTPEQVQAARAEMGLDKAPTSAQPATQTSAAPAVADWYTQLRNPQPQTPTQQTPTDTRPTIGQSIDEAGRGGVNQMKQSFQQAKDAKNPLQAINSGITFGAGLIGTLTSPLAPLFEPTKQTTQKIADKVSNIPAVQKFAMGNTGGKVISGAETLGNLSTVVGASAGMVGAPEARTAVANTAGDALNSVKSFPETATNGLREATANYADKSLRQEWQRPITEAKPTYKKAAEIYKNAKSGGHDITDTLFRNKLNPHDHVEGGNYSTQDSAQLLRDDAAKTSTDLLRPSLEMADHFTPKTPVKDVINGAAEVVRNNKSLTLETKQTLMKRLQDTYTALTKQHPDGMSLADLHDEKVTRGQNAKFSPVGDIATNLEAQKNYALNNALKNLVEKKAPEGVPVKEFNRELQKQYQAADYLDALHGKKVPTSLKQQIAKTTAKVMGAGVGHGLGGGILGGVGGYHIGGMVEEMFARMPNPIKEQFMRNLQKSNPEAFQKVGSFINEQIKSASERKALPAPSYVPMGGRTGTNEVSAPYAAKNPVTVNPKTSKFQTSYNSNPK